VTRQHPIREGRISPDTRRSEYCVNMARASRSQTSESTDEEPCDRVLVAGRCIEQHGIDKTTEDVALEAGMSRRSVYRYFADRDDLLVALISALRGTARQDAHIHLPPEDSARPSCRRTPLPRRPRPARPAHCHLLNLDGTSLARRMTASRTSEILTARFWDPFLDAAAANKELPRGMSRPDIHLCFANLGLMLMRGPEVGDGDVQRYRSILRRFVAPAFTVEASASGRRRPGPNVSDDRDRLRWAVVLGHGQLVVGVRPTGVVQQLHQSLVVVLLKDRGQPQGTQPSTDCSGSGRR